MTGDICVCKSSKSIGSNLVMKMSRVVAGHGKVGPRARLPSASGEEVRGDVHEQLPEETEEHEDGIGSIKSCKEVDLAVAC